MDENNASSPPPEPSSHGEDTPAVAPIPDEPTNTPAKRNEALATVNSVNRGLRGFLAVVALLAGTCSLAKQYRLFGKSLGEYVFSPEDCRSGLVLHSSTTDPGVGLGDYVGLRGQGLLGTVNKQSGICTSECANDTECPKEFACYQGNCIPDGHKAAGDECEHIWDCKSRSCGASVLDIAARMEADSHDDASIKGMHFVQAHCQ